MMAESSAKKRSLEETTTKRGRIQLLLHCEDGCVPFLNPSQLEKYFPPSETDLWLGLAVRDSCVAPIFDVLPNDDDIVEEGKNNKCNQKKKSDNSKRNKVRGFTFATNKPDMWLLPFTRMTVPSFELRNDECNNKKSKAGNTSKNSNAAVYVWTPHGRQKLTPELYATASLEGLQSQHTLSLFDDIDNENFSKKRKEQAEVRNQQWFQHLCQKNESLVKEATKDSYTVAEPNKINNSLLWKPILLPHDTTLSDDIETPPSSSSSSAFLKLDKDNMDHVSGVAFVGRWRTGMLLNKIQKNIESVQWKAIISTFSLSEILDIASEGTINVIGTNLPQKWAKKYLSVGLDVIEERISDPSQLDNNNKRQKKMTEETKTTTAAKILNADGCMDMSDKMYARDPNPLVAGCTCFACKDNRFSKAYVHHLVVAKEMLAEIIIFGHNLHSLIQLLRAFDSNYNSPDVVNEFIRRQLPSE
jgi:hypothetical protein